MDKKYNTSTDMWRKLFFNDIWISNTSILYYPGDSGIGFLFVRIAAGITTGTLAIFSAQPTDVVKVRMQAEMKKRGEKSQYKGVVDAYVTIAKTEGFKGLYKGE